MKSVSIGICLLIMSIVLPSFAADKPIIRFGVIPRYLLWNNGVHIQDLKRWENLQHHDAVAKAILKGQFDAGAVKDVVAEKYKSHGLRILAWSAPIPAVPLVVRKDAPPDVVRSLTAALLKLDRNNPVHQKICRLGTMNSATVLPPPQRMIIRAFSA